MIGPPPPTLETKFSSLTSMSPSFTARSSNNLADIASRVVKEFRNQNGHYDDDDDIYSFDNEPYGSSTESLNESEEEEEEDEFEFDVVCEKYNSSADQIFFNGEIVPRYPLFDTSLLLDEIDKFDSKPVRLPLGKLFNEEREFTSCSSSESDDLDGVAPETYCIWKPKDEGIENRKKSNSTRNTSKRWRFRNLVRRSNSDVNNAWLLFPGNRDR